MKSFFIYKNDAVRCAEASRKPFYKEFMDQNPPVKVTQNDLVEPSTKQRPVRYFNGFRVYRNSEEIMIYVEQ